MLDERVHSGGEPARSPRLSASPQQPEDLAVVVVEVFSTGPDGEAGAAQSRRVGIPGLVGSVGASVR
jgi:hypothetical protein